MYIYIGNRLFVLLLLHLYFGTVYVNSNYFFIFRPKSITMWINSIEKYSPTTNTDANRNNWTDWLECTTEGIQTQLD